MTSFSSKQFTTFFLIFFFLSLSVYSKQSYHRTLDPSALGLKKEKLSHLHFYFHDIISGRHPTAVQIISPPNVTSIVPMGFGSVVMIDDPLTQGLEPKSKVVGRAQGMYAFASQTDFGLLMVLNFCFIEGKYNGSTLSILGNNKVLNDVREMPVVGGSGLFRFARGYAKAHTHRVNIKTGDAVVEYNVYVLHY